MSVKLAEVLINMHKRKFKRENMNNSLVKHNLETNPNFNFKDSKMLVYIHYKKKRKKMSENC